MNKQQIDDCLTRTLQGAMTFPEVVGVLLHEGVERYRADLTEMKVTWYTANGQTHSGPIALQDAPGIADAFSKESVVSAIRGAQSGQLRYPEFLRAICDAGVTDYTAFLSGRRVVYTGRHGDSHTELFPS